MSADAFSVAPSETAATPICSCGATEPHPATDDRRSRGHVLLGNRVGRQFVPGNQTPRTHGVDSYKANGPSALPPELHQSVSQFRSHLVSGDLGGIDGLTAIELGIVRRLVELETVAQLFASDIATRGLFTKDGAVRATHGRWLRTVAAWGRYAERAQEIARNRQRSTLTLAARLAQAPVLSEPEDGDARE